MSSQVNSKYRAGYITGFFWFGMLAMLALYTPAALAAKAHTEKCYKLGDSVTVNVKKRYDGGSYDLYYPLCVKNPKTGKPSQFHTVMLDGNDIPSDVDMVVSGTLKDAYPTYGYSITIVSARDINDDAKMAYKASRGADMYNTCLQWQKDGYKLNVQLISGSVSPLYSPRCGISAVDNYPTHKIAIEEWMPEPGESYTAAKNIIDSAIANGVNWNKDESIDECLNWQFFVINELVKNHYPTSVVSG